VTVDSQAVALELARRGLAVARVNAFLVRDELARGALVDVLPELRTAEDVFAVYPDAGRPDPLVRALVQGALERATALGMWDVEREGRAGGALTDNTSTAG
jgi:DNA-binding transcriptional LysR family regulator